MKTYRGVSKLAREAVVSPAQFTQPAAGRSAKPMAFTSAIGRALDTWIEARRRSGASAIPSVPEGPQVTGRTVIRPQPVVEYRLIGSVRFPRSGSPGRRRKRIIGGAAAR